VEGPASGEVLNFPKKATAPNKKHKKRQNQNINSEFVFSSHHGMMQVLTPWAVKEHRL
jgi:hypothetical protein